VKASPLTGGLLGCLAAVFSANGLCAESRLGSFPLCEASAVAIVGCPGTAEDCLLVADNERPNQLFLFGIEDGALGSGEQRVLGLSGPGAGDVSDIEAVAPFGGDKILVFGSHSRNSQCEARKGRRRLAMAQVAANGARLSGTVQAKAVDCDHIFIRAWAQDQDLTVACDVIRSAEEKADAFELALQRGRLSEREARARCDQIAAFN